MVPARKFSTTTSALSTRRSTTARAAGAFRSRVRLFLLTLQVMNAGDRPSFLSSFMSPRV